MLVRPLAALAGVARRRRWRRRWRRRRRSRAGRSGRHRCSIRTDRRRWWRWRRRWRTRLSCRYLRSVRAGLHWRRVCCASRKHGRTHDKKRDTSHRPSPSDRMDGPPTKPLRQRSVPPKLARPQQVQTCAGGAVMAPPWRGRPPRPFGPSSESRSSCCLSFSGRRWSQAWRVSSGNGLFSFRLHSI
jgi:hypothetical protein